jgi:tripeptidyl-peptidase I
VAYAQRQCNEYGKLGMMGTTVLYSSGDNGVAGNGGNCITGIKFNPDFPASCPFVTAVGATQINPGSTVFEPESACEQVIYSGGGFSNIFAMPEYQEAAVHRYLKDYPPPYTALQYNNSGMVTTLLHCE